MQVFFAAYTPLDVTLLSLMGIKNIVLSPVVANRYVKKEGIRARLQKRFNIIGVFSPESISGVKYKKYRDLFADFIASGLRTPLILNSIVSYVTDGPIMFVSVDNNKRELEESETIRQLAPVLSNVKSYTSYDHTMLLGHFNYLLELHKRNALPDSIIVFDWAKVLEHKHITVYDSLMNDIDTIDFRGSERDNEYEFSSFDDVLTLSKYRTRYGMERFLTTVPAEGFEFNFKPSQLELLSMSFGWYYEPILDKISEKFNNFFSIEEMEKIYVPDSTD